MDIIITLADKDADAILGQLKAYHGFDAATNDEIAAQLVTELKSTLVNQALGGQTQLDRKAAAVSQVTAKTILDESVSVAVKAP